MTLFTIEHADWREHAEAIRAVRHAVFVQEQGIPAALEWDGRDPACRHVLAISHTGEPIGTARVQADGHIGRMAVLAPWRHMGVGRALLASLIRTAEEHRLTSVWLTAQVQAVGFYQRAGFVVDGDPFMEAGITHQRMVRRLVE